ncbi:hypothetical protein GCM10010320_35690 [Streptomyces caelestis]|nr:hypothetical protein GCM10010320_35690 [Streptomyces caelestis]
MSPDTARRWADAGRVATRRDESGKRVIDGEDLAAFSVELAGSGEESASSTSVRNAFPGIVTAVKLGDVAAQVEIQVGPAPAGPADAGGCGGAGSGGRDGGHRAGEVDGRAHRPGLTWAGQVAVASVAHLLTE